jgi:hypothetical protein
MWDELHIRPEDRKSTFSPSVPKETDKKVIGAFHFIYENANEFKNFCKDNKIRTIVDISEVERNEKKRDLNVIKKMTIYLASKMNEAGQPEAAGDLMKGVKNELKKKGFSDDEINNFKEGKRNPKKERDIVAGSEG